MGLKKLSTNNCKRVNASALLFVVMILFLLSSACSARTPANAPHDNVISLKLNPARPSNDISSVFLGDSMDPYRICDFVRLYQATPVMAQMLRNLGNGNIRIGGNSVEYTHWVPNGTASCGDFTNTTITRDLLANVFKVVKSLGRRATLAINLEHGDPTLSADEAAYAAATAGSTLIGIEIGNEPDLYGWGYNQFDSSWQATYNAIEARTPKLPIIGPSTCCNDVWYNSFLQEATPLLAFATSHNYATSVENNPTISDFLNPALMQHSADRIKSLAASAHAKHLMFNLNETNAVAGSPPDSIGGAFIMSLWGLDYALTAAENGADAMEFHGGVPGDATSPFYSNGNSVSPRPLYYGMLAFHSAVGNSAQVIPVQLSSPPSLHAHAVLRSDGKLSVILINDSLANTASVHVDTTASYASASAIELSAPSVEAQVDSITLGGSKVTPDGNWQPQLVEPVSVNRSASIVNVPPASAMIITYASGSSGTRCSLACLIPAISSRLSVLFSLLADTRQKRTL